VVGDDDGVVVVARHRLAQVTDLASEIAAREDAILASILDGATIADARKQHGYHTLQRKED
jgi:regulator of RNase E activity RraA